MYCGKTDKTHPNDLFATEVVCWDCFKTKESRYDQLQARRDSSEI